MLVRFGDEIFHRRERPIWGQTDVLDDSGWQVVDRCRSQSFPPSRLETRMGREKSIGWRLESRPEDAVRERSKGSGLAGNGQ